MYKRFPRDGPDGSTSREHGGVPGVRSRLLYQREIIRIDAGLKVRDPFTENPMNKSSRTGFAAVVLAAASLLAPGSASAQYPLRPVRIIVPNEAGGVYDLVGRLLAGELSKRLGQSVFVENRPGGGSVTGTLRGATATPMATRCSWAD